VVCAKSTFFPFFYQKKKEMNSSHLLVALKDVDIVRDILPQVEECWQENLANAAILETQVAQIEAEQARLGSTRDILEYRRLERDKQLRLDRIRHWRNRDAIDALNNDVSELYAYLSTSNKYAYAQHAAPPLPHEVLGDGDPDDLQEGEGEGEEAQKKHHPDNNSTAMAMVVSDGEDEEDEELAVTRFQPQLSRKRPRETLLPLSVEAAYTSIEKQLCLVPGTTAVEEEEEEEEEEKKEENNNNSKRSRWSLDEADAGPAEPIESAAEEEGEEEGPRETFEEHHARMMELLKRRNLLEDVLATPCYNLRQFCPNKKCGRPYINVQEEAKLVCAHCYTSISIIDSTPATVAFAADSENQQYSYERFTHLMNKMEPFLPHRETKIENEAETLDQIKYLSRQNRFAAKAEITFDKMSMFLKHLQFVHLYKAKYVITMKFNNKYWPIMTEHEELKIVLAFLVMQDSFERIKKSSRSSFLKYEFALWHMMAMQKFDRFKPYLKLLETKERHQKQLALLRSIAKQQKWPYIPSM